MYIGVFKLYNWCVRFVCWICWKWCFNFYCDSINVKLEMIIVIENLLRIILFNILLIVKSIE